MDGREGRDGEGDGCREGMERGRRREGRDRWREDMEGERKGGKDI